MTRLLARYAECIFWMGRYVERAENLARILDVQETFSRDSRGAHDWGVVLDINADRARFEKKHGQPNARSVLRFYVLDRDNPNSLVSDIWGARENARALRPLITTEMWTQLNVFYNRVLTLGIDDLAEERLSRLCAQIKDGCDAHYGITAGTFYRDEAWSFYELGRAIECADQTTRLLDAKLLAAALREGDDLAGDASYWTALLRSAAGYQAFRRRHPRGITQEKVALFMLCDPCFPRSVAHHLASIEEHLHQLRRRYGLKAANRAIEHLDGLYDDLEPTKVSKIIAAGTVHALDDFIQKSLTDLTGILGRSFFGWSLEEPDKEPVQAA
ncbi:alpha-E domain-containing protein [Geminicoccus roseus]|uniref:alpha-E domain-containing protein n=1 Tax=Geminicoccus roseus TaxID=404900 RepID=UPI00042904D2|nr:alpha-E domain-containing protein [Geminicoccus roseus]